MAPSFGLVEPFVDPAQLPNDPRLARRPATPACRSSRRSYWRPSPGCWCRAAAITDAPRTDIDLSIPSRRSRLMMQHASPLRSRRRGRPPCLRPLQPHDPASGGRARRPERRRRRLPTPFDLARRGSRGSRDRPRNPPWSCTWRRRMWTRWGRSALLVRYESWRLRLQLPATGGSDKPCASANAASLLRAVPRPSSPMHAAHQCGQNAICSWLSAPRLQAPPLSPWRGRTGTARTRCSSPLRRPSAPPH